jgi:hypothetical protein
MSVTEQADLRPPRLTQNLRLPIPGDAGPADYVTDTGALGDAVDQAIHQRDPGVTATWAEVYSITWGIPIATWLRIPIVATGPRSQINPFPGHQWRDADGNLKVPVPGIYTITFRSTWTAESTTGARWCYVDMAVEIPNQPTRQHSQPGTSNIHLITGVGPLKPDQTTTFAVNQNSAANLACTLDWVLVTLAVPLTEAQVDELQVQYGLAASRRGSFEDGIARPPTAEIPFATEMLAPEGGLPEPEPEPEPDPEA